MAQCCYIVPPHLLQAIASAEANPEPVRHAAQQALAQRERVVAERESRLTILAQPRGFRGAAAQQLGSRQSIIPDTLLRHIAESEEVDDETRACARRDLEHIQHVHTRYQDAQQGVAEPQEQHVVGLASGSKKKTPVPSDKAYRAVYDAKHSQNESALPGTLVRTEGQKEVTDKAVNESYDNFGNVLTFYKEKFNWNSIDNKGMQVISSVHFGKNYENACECPSPPTHQSRGRAAPSLPLTGMNDD